MQLGWWCNMTSLMGPRWRLKRVGIIPEARRREALTKELNVGLGALFYLLFWGSSSNAG